MESVPGTLNRMISTHGLTLTRGPDTVIDGLDWRAAAGGIAWVVGENGSGKSTLLSALAGRLKPSAGEVRMEPPLEPRERAMVWYHPHMRPPAEVRARDWARLTAVLAPTGAPPSLEPRLRRQQRLGQVSTGEQKRLLLEALLRQTSPIYLLDEPLEHLSPEAKTHLLQRLAALARSAVVVVATNQGAAADLADDFGPGVLNLLGGGAWRWRNG